MGHHYRDDWEWHDGDIAESEALLDTLNEAVADEGGALGDARAGRVDEPRVTGMPIRRPAYSPSVLRDLRSMTTSNAPRGSQRAAGAGRDAIRRQWRSVGFGACDRDSAPGSCAELCGIAVAVGDPA